jgi:DNA-binding NarL/FixJ family response regulator
MDCPLCDRELDVLCAYHFPINIPYMADMLGMTLHTFYTHQKNIIRKLKVPTITHAVCLAKDEKWI